MPLSQVLNPKGLIKKSTNNDLPFAPQAPVMSAYYGVTTAAQTVINLTFSVDTVNLSDQFFLFVDGKKLRLGSSNDYQFTSIGSNGYSTQVTLNASAAAGQNIQAYFLGLRKEVEFNMDNRFVQLYAAQNAGFQGFVNPTDALIAPTTSVGTPVAGTFYSLIPNRASMMDLSQDLKARMGVERIMFQNIYQIYNEAGPNGESVYGLTNDTFGQVRFIGTWVNTTDNNGPARPGSSGTANVDSVEITFYGTGLNALLLMDAAARTLSYSVDGGSLNAISNTSGSAVIQGRNYAQNIVVPVVHGLALGIHTVRILATGAVNTTPFGVEIYNANASNVTVNAGTGYVQGKKYTSTQSAFAYSSVVTGTRGGRVVVYQNGDGSIGKAWQATNAASAFLTSADHTNEEIVRTYQVPEFGAGRADDFSGAVTTNSSLAFALDDGTTTMIGSSVTLVSVGGRQVGYPGGSAFTTFTFVGTGCDIQILSGSTTTGTITASLDGTSLGTITYNTTGTNVLRNYKIASGLPYGTHIVRIAITGSVANVGTGFYTVYQPKKPIVPSGAVELADYNVFGNYVANTTAGADTIGTGVLRKNASREFLYTGTWTIGLAPQPVGGFNLGSTTTGDSVRYTFFGTGFELRFANNATSATWQLTVDGSTNLSGFTTSSYGAGVTSFTASTGTLVSSTTGVDGNGVSVSNMSLGVHTVVWTKTAGAGALQFNALDLISPIHVQRSNLYADFQSTLPIGSQGISDNRRITPVKDALPSQKAWGQALAITASPTTSSTVNVPLPDMSLTLKTSGGIVQCSFANNVTMSTSGDGCSQWLYIDGVQIGVYPGTYAGSTSAQIVTAGVLLVSLAPGVHKFDIYWRVTGAATATSGGNRVFSVKEQ